jgi:MFS family permease
MIEVPSAEDGVSLTRQQIATLAAAIVCIAVVGIGLSLSSPLISLVLAGRGISATVIGLNTACASLATVLIGSFVTPIARSLGLRRFVILALAIGGGALSLFPTFDSLFAWFVLRFIYGSAIGTLFVLSEYWINAAAPPQRRGVVMGVYATALALGFAAGPAILAVAGGATNTLFFVGSSFFAIAAMPILAAGDLAPPIEGQATKSAWGFITVAPVATLAGFIFGAIEQGSFAFLTLYGEDLGYDTADAALLLVLFGLGNVASQLPIGFLSDRLSRRGLLLACAAISCTGALLMPVAAAFPLALMADVFVTGGVVGGLYTLGLAHLGARFRGLDLATANAAFVMLYSLGMLAGAPAFGIVFDAVKPHGFAYAFAALCGGYCILVIVKMRRSDS